MRVLSPAVALATLAIAAFGLLLSGCISSGKQASSQNLSSSVVPPELVIYTYDGITADWGLGPKIFPAFEAECGCRVRTVAPGDVGAMVALLSSKRSSPEADVALGIDNTFKSAAIEKDILAPYAPPNLAFADASLLDGDNRFIPFDWGYVAFVYDSEKMPNPPQSLDDLLKPEFRKKFVIEDARTSSPGKVFLYWVAAEKGNSTREYLSALKSQALTVAPGWSEAYNLFTAGEVPMVLSYTTSPAYHILNDNTTKYKAAVFAKLPRQIEYVSVVKGAPHRELARKFVDFMLSAAAQKEIPLGNYMYPAVPSTPLPAAFNETPMPAGFVAEPQDPQKWMQTWGEIFSP